jgi:uncharacterized protein
MPSNPLAMLRLNAVEILRQPGTSREIVATLPIGPLEVDDVRISGDVDVALRAVSSVDGVVLHGLVRTPWATQCRRCLVDVAGVAESEVDELFQYNLTNDEANQIEGDLIELAPIVREYVLLELPVGPLCRPDCAGICPECGADRNESPCSCDNIVGDLRWAALEGLRLDEHTSDGS